VHRGAQGKEFSEKGKLEIHEPCGVRRQEKEVGQKLNKGRMGGSFETQRKRRGQKKVEGG